MNRFEKKCFIGSAGFHGLLLLVFVFGSAFISSRKTIEIPPVVNLYAIPTDKIINSGGNPNSVQPQPQSIQQPQPPAPPPVMKEKPPEPEPEQQLEKKPVQTKRVETKPKEPVQKETAKPKDRGDLPTTAKKSDINTNVVVRPRADLVKLQKEADAREARQRADREAQQRYADERRRIAKDVGSAVGNLNNSLSKNVVVDAGPGPGGPAFANYGGLVGAAYKRAVDANHPQSDEDVDALIRVVVLRDGRVQSAEWVRRTPNSLLNKAVDGALKSVRSVPPFPAETKDTEREFTIRISFEAKRGSA